MREASPSRCRSADHRRGDTWGNRRRAVLHGGGSLAAAARVRLARGREPPAPCARRDAIRLDRAIRHHGVLALRDALAPCLLRPRGRARRPGGHAAVHLHAREPGMAGGRPRQSHGRRQSARRWTPGHQGLADPAASGCHLDNDGARRAHRAVPALPAGAGALLRALQRRQQKPRRVQGREDDPHLQGHELGRQVRGAVP